MVMLSNNWQVVAEATRAPGAARVTYKLWARINPQYHSIELNRDWVEVQTTYELHVGYIYSGTWTFTGTGCSTVSGGGTLRNSGTLLDGGFWAYHDTNGNYSNSINADLSFYFSAADAYLEGAIELPNIPRASGAVWKNNKNRAKLDGENTETITLLIDKKVQKYRHNISWVVGSSGQKLLQKNVDTEYAFTPTEDMIQHMTDAPYVYGNIVIDTYASGEPGAVLIGTRNVGFFIDLPQERYGPIITAAEVKEIGNNKVTDEKVFRYLSRKKLTMQVETRGFATIKNIYAVHNKQQTPLKLTDGKYIAELEGMVDGNVQFVIEDSRGFVKAQEWRGTFVPYFYPTLTEFSAERDNPTVNDGYASAKGTYYNGESNQLTITLKDEQGHSVNCAYTPNGNNFAVKQRVSGYRYDQNYQLTLVLTDSYGQRTERSYVLTGNLWAMILGKLTTSVHMLWVRRNGNNPCGIYNEGDMTTVGTTYTTGKLIASGGIGIKGTNTFIIRKEFSGTHQPLSSMAAAYITIPFTIPDGYELLDIYRVQPEMAITATIKSVYSKSCVVHVFNSWTNWSSPSGKVTIHGIFIKKEA